MDRTRVLATRRDRVVGEQKELQIWTSFLDSRIAFRKIFFVFFAIKGVFKPVLHFWTKILQAWVLIPVEHRKVVDRFKDVFLNVSLGLCPLVQPEVLEHHCTVARDSLVDQIIFLHLPYPGVSISDTKGTVFCKKAYCLEESCFAFFDYLIDVGLSILACIG